MLIAVPKEIKSHEYRVAMTPAGARELISAGHQVWVQSQAGIGSGFSDQDYQLAGAQVVAEAETLFAHADLIVKVKEPLLHECQWLRPNQILFTYLHLAPNPELTQALLNSGCIAIAYETLTDRHGGLPLLAPMSEVAGRMAIQVGAHCLEKAQGGAGLLLAGVPGVAPAEVLILGGGVVGQNAARMALGLGAKVSILDKSLPRLRELEQQFGSRLVTLYSTRATIEQQLTQADLVIGAVLVPGATAPKLIQRSMLSLLKPGSVLVDVAIDQGGCFESSQPTTHQQPTYTLDGIVHYCVTNMPGAVARTSTLALTNATLAYLLLLANKGWLVCYQTELGFAQAVNIAQGELYLNELKRLYS